MSENDSNDSRQIEKVRLEELERQERDAAEALAAAVPESTNQGSRQPAAELDTTATSDAVDPSSTQALPAKKNRKNLLLVGAGVAMLAAAGFLAFAPKTPQGIKAQSPAVTEAALPPSAGALFDPTTPSSDPASEIAAQASANKDTGTAQPATAVSEQPTPLVAATAKPAEPDSQTAAPVTTSVADSGVAQTEGAPLTPTTPPVTAGDQAGTQDAPAPGVGTEVARLQSELAALRLKASDIESRLRVLAGDEQMQPVSSAAAVTPRPAKKALTRQAQRKKPVRKVMKRRQQPMQDAQRTTRIPAAASGSQGQVLGVDIWDGKPSVVVGTGTPGDRRLRVLSPGESVAGIALKSADPASQTATFHLNGQDVTLGAGR